MESRKDQILVFIEDIDDEFCRLIPCKIIKEEILPSPKSENGEDASESGTPIIRKKYVIQEIVERKRPGASKEELEQPAGSNLKRLIEKFELTRAKALGKSQEPQPSTSSKALTELQATNNMNKQQKGSKSKLPLKSGKENFPKVQEPKPSLSKEALKMTKKCQQKEVSKPAFESPTKGKKVNSSVQKGPQPSTSKQPLKKLNEITKKNQQKEVSKPIFKSPSTGKKVSFSVQKELQPSTGEQAIKELNEITKNKQQKEVLKLAFKSPPKGQFTFWIKKVLEPITSEQALNDITEKNQQKEDEEPQPSTSNEGLKGLKEITKTNQQKEALKPAFEYPSKGKTGIFSEEKEPQPSTSKQALHELQAFLNMYKQPEHPMEKSEDPFKPEKETIFDVQEPQPRTCEQALQELQAFINMYKEQENFKMGKSEELQVPFKPGMTTTFDVQEPQPSTSEQTLHELQAMNNTYNQKEKFVLEDSEIFKKPLVPRKQTSLKVVQPKKTLKVLLPKKRLKVLLPKKRLKVLLPKKTLKVLLPKKSRRKKGKASAGKKSKQPKRKTEAKAPNPRTQSNTSNTRKRKVWNAPNENCSPMTLRSSQRKTEEDSNQLRQEPSESIIQSNDLEIKEKKKEKKSCGIPEMSENPSGDLIDSQPLEDACVSAKNDEKTSAKNPKERGESYRVLQVGPNEFIKLRCHRIENGKIKRDSRLLRSDSSSESEMETTKEFNQIEGVQNNSNTSKNNERFDDPAGSMDDEHNFSVAPNDPVKLSVYRIEPQTVKVTFEDPSKSGMENNDGQSRKYMPATYSRDVECSYREVNNHCGRLRVFKFEPRRNLEPVKSEEPVKPEEPLKSKKRPYRSRSKVKRERSYKRVKLTPEESFSQIQTRSKTMAGQKRKYYNYEDSDQTDEEDLYIPRSSLNCFEPVYCLCENVSHGVMVMCDNQICPYEWFHISCLSMAKVPRGKWYCPKCRGSRPNTMKSISERNEALVKYNKEKEDKE